jgi:16S rRNA (guanine(966)-N(2))-methyltransferase RsmD
MRITAGEARGRVLKTREGKATRPTDARARETLFNILGERVEGAAVLDLYAGSGAIALEALSRAAHSCVLVESNAVACRIIRENLKLLHYAERAEVWNTTVRTALTRLVVRQAGFDIVFADPPFIRAGEVEELCHALDNSAELLHNGNGKFDPILVLQHHRRDKPILSRFKAVQERRAGESVLSFFELITAK